MRKIFLNSPQGRHAVVDLPGVVLTLLPAGSPRVKLYSVTFWPDPPTYLMKTARLSRGAYAGESL